MLKDSTNTLHALPMIPAYLMQSKSWTEKVAKERHPYVAVWDSETGQTAAAKSAGGESVSVADLKARHPGAFLPKSETAQTEPARKVDMHAADAVDHVGPACAEQGKSWTETVLRARYPGAFVSDPESIQADEHVAVSQNIRADAPPFIPGQGYQGMPTVDSWQGIEGQTSVSYAIPGSPAPNWNLPDDPFGPTPVKGKQAVLPTGHAHQPGCSPLNGAQPPPFTATPRRSLPFNESQGSCYASAYNTGCGPLMKTSTGITLNPAFKAAPSSGATAADPSGLQYAATSAGRMPMYAASSRAVEVQNPSQAYIDVSLSTGNGPYSRPATTMPLPTAVKHTGAARPQPLEPGHDLNAGRVPGHSLLPLSAPSRPCADPWNANANPRYNRTVTSTDTTANKKYRLAPMAPQKMASYCHVKHSRKEMPDLPKEAVKSLVQVLAF